MTRQFEDDDMQPDGIPYTVFAKDLTDHTTFIQGLRNAGFEIHDEDVLVMPCSPERAIVTFASGVHAKQAMLALHLREFKGMEGKKMRLMKASPQRVGWDDRSPCAPLPTRPVILQAMGEAYFERAIAPRRAQQAALRLAEWLRKQEKRIRDEEAVRQAKEAKDAKEEAKDAKKAANIKKAQEAKLAKDTRRAQHLKRMEEAKLKKQARMKEAKMKEQAKITTQPDENQSDGLRDIKAKWDGELSDGFEGMEHVEAVAGKDPKVSAWLEAMKQQDKDRDDLGSARQG